MLPSFLLSLREGLEMALIIGIVLGALTRFKRSELNRTVWGGVIAAGIVSIAVAIGLQLLGLEFEGRGEQIFEGTTMLLAAGLLTWMIFWMQRTARTLKGELETKTQNALNGQGRGLFALAFLAVVREGVELALFLLAVEKGTSPIQTLIGAVVGLAGAALMGWMLFSSSRRLSVSSFFKITNVLLIIFAAGLVAVGVHEFNEAGIIPALIDPLWDINGILSDKSEIGMLLKALFGYNGNPSLTEVLAYLAYLTGIGAWVYALRQKPASKAVSTSAG